MEEASTPAKRESSRLLRGLWNPLLIKELRGRMRGARAFVVLTVYLLLLSCFTSIIYYAFTASVSGPSSASDMAYLGKVVFASVVIIEIFMVTFITPAFTAGAISGEKERQTYELLRTTLLPARKVVFGKFSSALTYMLLLILAAVPLESLAFVLGGVEVEELALALVILLVGAFFFAAMGLFFSSIMRSTLASTILSYVVALLGTVGLPILLLIFATMFSPMIYGIGSSPTSWMVEAATMYGIILFSGLSPISAAVLTEVFLLDEDALFYFWYDIYSGMGGGSSPHAIPIPSPWTIYVLIYMAVALILLLITILQVRRQAKQ
ncbi:MAG: ABC transporter permease subunit [Anaerolineae bacterium]|nr:ABC transporter permease subunit [Anaerolineae bacterium]